MTEPRPKIGPQVPLHDAGAVPTPGPVLRATKGRFEWLLRSHALHAARTRVVARGERVDELQRRARVCTRLAERILDPADELRTRSGSVLAADLYRQAAHWALTALYQDGSRFADTSSLWASIPAEDLQAMLPTQALRESARGLLVDHTFIELAEKSAAEQRSLAHTGRMLAEGTLAKLETLDRQIDRLLWQRLVRVGSLATLVVVLAICTPWAIEAAGRGPDLTVGRPWRASSQWADCDISRRQCGSLRSDIFFHTKEDQSPWIEYDLGAPRTFSRVYVVNRTDSVPDRAVPLVVEVSDDQKIFRAVARRNETFKRWTAEFSPQRARYVRLRVDRRSWLHLEKVMIY